MIRSLAAEADGEILVMVVVTIMTAAFPRLFQFMAAPLCLLAMFSVSANRLLEVAFGFFNAPVATVVVAVQGFGWQSAPCHEACSEDQR